MARTWSIVTIVLPNPHLTQLRPDTPHERSSNLLRQHLACLSARLSTISRPKLTSLDQSHQAFFTFHEINRSPDPSVANFTSSQYDINLAITLDDVFCVGLLDWLLTTNDGYRSVFEEFRPPERPKLPIYDLETKLNEAPTQIRAVAKHVLLFALERHVLGLRPVNFLINPATTGKLGPALLFPKELKESLCFCLRYHRSQTGDPCAPKPHIPRRPLHYKRLRFIGKRSTIFEGRSTNRVTYS